MKRITHIRRRRYLARAVSLGFAAAALLPAAAFAAPDEHGAPAAVDPYASSPVSAEDNHGMSAANHVVLPSADRGAVVRANLRGDNVTPPHNVTAASATGSSATDWGQVALWSSIGLAGIVGLILVGGTARRTRVAHP